jgi:hypothetical protein
MHERRRFVLPAVLAFALVLTGCGDATSSVLPPRFVAGIYVLKSVTGRGPTAGSFALSANGAATRSVQYTGTYAGTYVAVGTFSLVPGTIEFALREDNGQSPYEWKVRGEWSGHTFTLRYPDPADGWITETFEREGTP